MRVFLTGGTGYLGDHVARALLDAGHEVLALVRDRERGAPLAGRGASLVVGDLTEPSSWAHRLAEAEGVVHVAAKVSAGTSGSEEFERVNVTAALDLLDRARAAKIDRVVVTSSLFVLGPSPDGSPRDEEAVDEGPGPLGASNEYVRTKADAARAIRRRQQRGSPVMMVFPTVLLGPGNRTRGNHTARVLADVARRRLPGLVGDGKQIWNLAPVEDVAGGVTRVLERGRPGENYILGGENWTQERLVRRAAELFGVNPPTRRLGRMLPLATAAVMEFWAGVLGREPKLTRGEVRLYDAHWSFTSGKAQRELGYHPRPVEETLADTVTWLREEVLPAES